MLSPAALLLVERLIAILLSALVQSALAPENIRRQAARQALSHLVAQLTELRDAARERAIEQHADSPEETVVEPRPLVSQHPQDRPHTRTDRTEPSADSIAITADPLRSDHVPASIEIVSASPRSNDAHFVTIS